MQAQDFDSLEQVLTEDAKQSKAKQNSVAKPGASKHISSGFHLNSTKTATELNIQLMDVKWGRAPVQLTWEWPLTGSLPWRNTTCSVSLLHGRILCPCLVQKMVWESQTNTMCQIPPSRFLGPTSQGDSGKLSIDSRPAFTNRAAAQACCVLVDRCKQWNTSLKLAISTD